MAILARLSQALAGLVVVLDDGAAAAPARHAAVSQPGAGDAEPLAQLHALDGDVDEAKAQEGDAGHDEAVGVDAAVVAQGRVLEPRRRLAHQDAGAAQAQAARVAGAAVHEAGGVGWEFVLVGRSLSRVGPRGGKKVLLLKWGGGKEELTCSPIRLLVAEGLGACA